MTFRERLIATIRAARPVLESPGVLVVGSEVPNLLEAGAAATLVVSQDLDVGVPVAEHAAVPRDEAERLIAEGFRPDPVGWELSPSRLILVVPPGRAAQIPTARPLAVRLSAELLAAECIVLVAFPASREPA
ncbi:MAG TPA: hypothetical protein VLL75_05260 [Vicinamibacteria bacterium]|nr:hypothetical protein [Vicinamibacteria bacterium]